MYFAPTSALLPTLYRYFFLAISSVVVIGIPFVWNFYLESFQKKRILSLVFEGSDPEAEYNLVQSKAAIASGGLAGNNLRQLYEFTNGFVYFFVGILRKFRAGLGIRRAPEWMIKCHLEWLYRIFSEPAKQIRRVWNILKVTPSIILDEWKRKKRCLNS